MPRSGTSFAAGVFGALGYYAVADPDKELRKGDEHNPFGYWEAEQLVEMNVEVLRRVGYSHHNTWMYPAIGEEAAARITDLEPTQQHRDFVSAYANRAPWMWKDPRMCYTLPYWWKMMDADNTAVLLMRRPPKAIYYSFLRVGWVDTGRRAHADVLRKIDQHMKAADAALRDLRIPYVAVEYDKLAKSAQTTAADLSRLFRVTLSAADLNVQPQLDHSTFTRRIMAQARRKADALPAPLRAGMKRLIPGALLRAAFPEKVFEGQTREAGAPKTESHGTP
jgi:hypothetical protein